MIQKCKVTYRNKFLNIIVFEFKEKEIQMTLDIPDGTKVVYIKYENGKYSAVSEQEYVNSIKPIIEDKIGITPNKSHKKIIK